MVGALPPDGQSGLILTWRRATTEQNDTVGQLLDEYAASPSTAAIRNRSRRMMKVRKMLDAANLLTSSRPNVVASKGFLLGQAAKYFTALRWKLSNDIVASIIFRPKLEHNWQRIYTDLFVMQSRRLAGAARGNAGEAREVLGRLPGGGR